MKHLLIARVVKGPHCLLVTYLGGAYEPACGLEAANRLLKGMGMSRRTQIARIAGLGITLGVHLSGAALAQSQPSGSAVGQAVGSLIAANEKRANSYLDSASVIVFGSQRGIYQVIGDLRDLTAPGSPHREAVLLGKFGLIDAIAFEKAKLANPALSGIRQATIDKAFVQVYGRVSTPLEQAQLDPQLRSGKLWYAPLVIQEQGRLSSDKQLRATLIQQIYQRALGRPGPPSEVGYWVQRNDDYTAMIAAARSWLYSPPGAKDLIETVARAQQARNLPTDPATIKMAMAKYEPAREIYSEMVGLSGVLFKKLWLNLGGQPYLTAHVDPPTSVGLKHLVGSLATEANIAATLEMC